MSIPSASLCGLHQGRGVSYALCMLVHRHDSHDLLSAVRTDEGYYLVEAYVARPGIYKYLRADGTTQLELVPEDELHDAESLGTLARKPVTYPHPLRKDNGGMVSPSNVGRLQVGDVDGSVTIADNGFVAIKMAVRRSDAITAIERGVVEMSPGYTVELDETPGVDPVYGRYDAIQRRRRYNHAAIVHKARGGSRMRLRLDGHQATTQEGPSMLRFLKILGIDDIRTDADDDTQADAVYAGIAQLIKERDGLQARVDSAPDSETVEKARLDYFNAREPLLKRAAEFKVDAVDTLGNEELVKAVVLAARPQLKTDASAEYYSIAYELLPEPPAVSKAYSNLGHGLGKEGETRQDGLDPDEIKVTDSRAAFGEAHKPA